MGKLKTRREPRPAVEPRAELPGWGKRAEWAAYGLIAGYVLAIGASLALLSLVGTEWSWFVFRVIVYSLPIAGFDYAGERPRWRPALLRGFALGTAIAILRTLAAML
ncbi:MAG TPA: hypothetical protein VE913_16730 [Longimicrobium sp.]|nr:hypothetical protein [Longimicrobium sp.]